MVAGFRRGRLVQVEIEDVAEPIVAERFRDFGYRTLEIHEDRDYDGDPILRMTASVTTRVPATLVIDAMDAVGSALLANGEERLVFLGTRTPEADVVEDDED